MEEDSDAEVGDDTEEEMKEVTDMADSAQSLLTPPVSQSQQKVDMTLINTKTHPHTHNRKTHTH